MCLNLIEESSILYLSDIVPIKENLSKCFIIFESSCNLCKNTSESTFHIFLFYPDIKALWFTVCWSFKSCNLWFTAMVLWLYGSLFVSHFRSHHPTSRQVNQALTQNAKKKRKKRKKKKQYKTHPSHNQNLPICIINQTAKTQ